MAPKSKPGLKQGTLPFASAKRSSTAAGKTNALKASPAVASVKPSTSDKREQGSRTASIDSTISINTTSTDPTIDDDVVVIPSTVEQSTKRRKTENEHVKRISGPVKIVRNVPRDYSDSSSEEEPEELDDLKDLEKNPRIQRLYNQAKLRMGDGSPVHAEKQTKINHILRVFDTSYEYGPCIGMTRLQRWERAHALGLNPPPEIREILMSRQGREDDIYKQCIFYDDV